MFDFITTYIAPYWWAVWLVLFLIFLVIEALTCEAFIIWFAAGAFVTMFVSIAVEDFLIQFAVFAIFSIILLYFTRPVVLRRLNKNKIRTNIDASIGQIAVVVKEITAHEKGEVKHQHLVWMATSRNKKEIEVNKQVRIVAVQGATLIVDEVTIKRKEE